MNSGSRENFQISSIFPLDNYIRQCYIGSYTKRTNTSFLIDLRFCLQSFEWTEISLCHAFLTRIAGIALSLKLPSIIVPFLCTCVETMIRSMSCGGKIGSKADSLYSF